MNWDPVDQTVLANEQVVDGRGWRSGAPVERRELPQWFLKITDYAPELLDALDALPGWPESVKSMQRNWIGRSEGVEIDFDIEGTDAVSSITVFTTRPDTLLGATYVAVAAEHPLAAAGSRSGHRRLPNSSRAADRVKSAEAELATMEKRGIATRCTAVHPLTGESLPVWIANFVLMEYGSGAVMSVPAHDERDWEFAQTYGLPIVQVIEPVNDDTADISEAAYVPYGRLVNSGEYDGLTSEHAFERVAAALESRGRGRRRVNYRLRDWGVSRQRYWGCPIPMIHCDACGVVPVPEQDLPVLLPTDVQFEGVSSPLTQMQAFLDVACPECGGPAQRETDTFDTFMESSWYYARFASPDANKPMLDERADLWTPVDHYVGGIEHAILHLLYARFFHKLMRDHGLVSSDEPFTNLLMLGMVLKDGRKMSKSAGDAGNPQKLIDKYGADAVRTAMMFAAPPEQSFEWSEAGVEGQARFLRRLWAVVMEHAPLSRVHPGDVDLSDAAVELRRKTHQTLKRAQDDYGRRLQFNTVVSAVHELVNQIRDVTVASDGDKAAVAEALRAVLVVLSPIAPHITQALWTRCGEPGLLVQSAWPAVDEDALIEEQVQIVVQVNGKVRGKVDVAADAPEAAVVAAAQENENVVRHLDGKSPRKVIFVPGRLVNLVVG